MIKLDRKVWIYIIALLVLSFLVQFFVITNGGEDYEQFNTLIGIMMFFPAIGSILYLVLTKEGLRYINWKVGNPLYLFLSLTIPTLITILGIFVFESMGWASNLSYSITGTKVEILDLSLFLGTEDQSLLFFLLNILVTGMGYSIIVGLVTLGEEIGWRGFLQKKLLENNGFAKSISFLGLVWGFWHFPLIINGFNYPEYPVWGAFLFFPLSAISISFLFAWLNLNARSVWPAVFAHGGINSIMTLLFELDYGEHKFKANFGILGIWILVGIISFYLTKQEFKQKEIQ